VVRQGPREPFWGLRKSVPGLWCRVESLPEAGGHWSCWPATGDRVTRSSFGRRQRRCGGVRVFVFFFTCCSCRLLARADGTGKTQAAAQDLGTAAVRVTPSWTAGGRRTGSPPGRLAGVRQGRSGHRRGPRPLATTGGGRRSGSPLVGRPAGLCQGRPLLLRPPSGPATFSTPLRGARHPLHRSRGSGEVFGHNGGKGGRPAASQ
jgi:hypothetical protein